MNIKNNRTLIPAILLYTIVITVLLVISLCCTNGVFVYALDDTYIHMSMADNLSANGHFATNKIYFSSASSSPLWVLVLTSVYFITGKNLITPFILNLIFQFISIYVFYRILKSRGVQNHLLLYLFAFIFITPLPALLFSGMEHSLQLAAGLVFIFYSLNILSGKTAPGKFDIAVLLVASAVFAGTRYEDLIPLFIVCVLLFIKGKRGIAVLILIAGLIPVFVYGFISISNGAMFFPNTLLLKSSLPAFKTGALAKFLIKAVKNLSEPHIIALLVLLGALFIYNYKKRSAFFAFNSAIVLVSGLSLVVYMAIIEYNHNGSFYRYDAFLTALAVTAISLNLPAVTADIKIRLNAINNKFSKVILIILFALVLTPLFLRMFTAAAVPTALKEYYSQQYQMAQFCKLYAGNKTIALNDIGIVNYYTDNKVFDLLGLSNTEIAKHRINRTYSTSVIDSLGTKENVKLAMCYASWFDEYGGLPKHWKKIARWVLNEQDYFLGNPAVDIFITDPADEQYFREKLTEYSARLPEQIKFEPLK